MAAPLFVQAFKNAAGSGFVQTVTTAASGASTVSGNAILVFCQTQAGANDITSVTDNKGNTYTRLTGLNSGTTIDLEIWICRNITGGAGHTVTTNESAFTNGNVIAVEISGIPTTGTILDGTGTQTGSNSGAMSATLGAATTNANDLLILFSCITSSTLGTWTAGTIGGSAGANLTVSASTTSGAYTCAIEFKGVTTTSAFSGAISQSITNQSDATIMVAISDTAIVGVTSSAKLEPMGVVRGW